MKFDQPLLEGRLIRRYKRFLADVRLSSGCEITVHCPNTGSMMGCTDPGSRVWLGHSPNPRRKYAHTWQLVQVSSGALVGINTGSSNRLVRELLDCGRIDSLAAYSSIRQEVRYGVENSRIDLFLEDPSRPPCYLEVKNVTAAVERGIAMFPDAVSTRASKHLRELINVVRGGARAMVFFCVQRADVSEVRPADSIDPEYGRMLRLASAAGVEVMAWGARVTPVGVTLTVPLPVVCP